LTAHVAALREEANNLDEIRRARTEQLGVLKTRASELQESCAFVQLACKEYRRGVGVRATQAALSHINSLFAPLDKRLAEGVGDKQLVELVDATLESAEQWNRHQLGGAVLDGKAADSEGKVLDGSFIMAGPQSWFVTDDGALGGAVVTRPGSVLPGVEAVGEDVVAALKAVETGDVRLLPVDVSCGDAFKVVAAKPTLAELWVSGGAVMYPLALVAVAAVLLVLLKVVQLARMHVNRSFSDACDSESLIHLQHNVRTPLAPLLEEAVANKDAPRAHLEELLAENVAAQVPLFERHLGTLAVLGGVAPLLGLLGTVTGMIHTFRLVSSLGTGNARLLSGGISEALTTTLFGLSIAIPILLVHAFLARRARIKLSLLEYTASRLVNVLQPRGKEGEA
jgi:biopolymer transport protein ExbB